MNLLVFAILIIGLIGIYAQALSLQAARLAAQQSGLATTMLTWHAAAVSMAASIIDTNPPGLVLPCSLAIMPPPPPSFGLPSCAAPTGDANGTVTNAGYAPSQIFNTRTGQSEPVHLPANYDASKYQFYSVLYRDPNTNNQPYVVTFVSPPVISLQNPAPGLIVLPPVGIMTGFGLGDLTHQLQVSGVPGYSYGTVNNIGGVSTLVTGGTKYTVGTAYVPGFQYTLPSNIFTNGEVAVISSPAGF
jgi:hypothetical protein